MLINISNHPSSQWPLEQLQAARDNYEVVVDIPFPQINPTSTSEQIDSLVEEYRDRIVNQKTKPIALVQGESIFTYRLICELKKCGIVCIAARSSRRVVESLDENKNPKRESIYIFEGFLEY
ncbi:MAG: hypothetical protein K6F26_03345 [Lachnospiraceae bacterium]|nr:hypothetical protein [Lachnospiraceae bacterium]